MPIPKIVVTVALMAAQTAIGMMKKTEGPRLDELDVTTADYGTPIPRFWGKRRFECPVIWAEKLKEKKKKSKGKTGKYAEYKYFGTWAVAVADQEVDAVSRIWLDRRLTYDTTKAGPISIASLFRDRGNVKLTNGKNMRIYLGTETQEPDPRYEDWAEDRYGGTGYATAYRGVTYIVFEDIPLEKFGNRIPQVSVEAVHTKTDIHPYEISPTAFSTQRAQFSPDFMRLHFIDINDSISVVDVPTRTEIITFASSVGGTIGVSESAIYANGSDGLVAINPDGGESVLTTIFDFASTDVYYAGGLIMLTPSGGIIPATHYYSGSPSIGVIATATDFVPSMYFEDLAGNPWAVGEVQGENKVGFLLMPDGVAQLVDTTDTGPAYAMCNEDGMFLVWQAGKLFVVDPETWTAGTPVAASMGSTGPDTPFRNIRPGTASIWIHAGEYDTSDASLIRVIVPSSWHPSAFGEILYDPVNHALITFIGSDLAWLFLDRVGNAGVTLETVVDSVAGWCGLSGHDATALTQTVEGYSVTQGSGKDMLAPLLDIHDVDPRPHDFQVQFVNRGATPSITITVDEVVREGNDARYVATVTQDTDLPQKITLTFADSDHDHQPNTVIAQRPAAAVDTVREGKIDGTTYVSTPEDAQKFADRYLRRQWIGRERFTLALTAQRIAFEPADLAILSLDGVTTKARLNKLTKSGGRLNTEWERDDPAVHVLGPGTGASMDGRDDEVIFIPGPTKGFAKDIPLLSDEDANSNPLVYYGAGPYLSSQNWPGAFFMRGDPDGIDYDTEWNDVESSNAATWGSSTDALGDADPWLWDRGNTVNIKGDLTLTSCTEADIDDDPTLNLALLGDELLNFTTATLEGDGSYTLSSFKRGRRGTEWATGAHVAGEDFVLASTLLSEGLGLSEVGTELHFKAQTLGREIDGAAPIDLDFTGATLKPYAPARIIWTTDGTDLFGEIIRRTRLGGSWTDDGVVPLSENSEAYEVDVLDGSDVVRTITVTGTNAFTYLGTDLTADGFSLSDIPNVNVYQMSDAVGRGFALAA